MADNSQEALLDIANMVDIIKDACMVDSRNELEAIRNRLRHLAKLEHDLDTGSRRLHIAWDDEVGDCDQCGSKLVWRGRNPSTLVCPLGCEETGP